MCRGDISLCQFFRHLLLNLSSKSPLIAHLEPFSHLGTLFALTLMVTIKYLVNIKVVKNRKKVVAALLAIAFCIAGTLCRAQSPQVEPEKINFQNSTLFSSNDPNLGIGSSKGAGTTELFYKSMMAVVFVIVLGIAAVYVSKKFLPKITNLSGKKIKIIETLNFGTRKALHLVKIGNKHILIASTVENITKLDDVTDALSDSLQEN